MTCSTPPGKAQRSYVLRLLNGLLAWETTVSRGRLPRICRDSDEFSSRLMLIERLMSDTPADLARLGFPNPLPSAATMLRQTITELEGRAGLAGVAATPEPPTTSGTAS